MDRLPGRTHATVQGYSSKASQLLLDGTLRLWDLKNWLHIGIYEGHRGRINGLGLSSDGNIAVSVGGDGTVRVWDVDTGKERDKLEGHVGWVWTVAMSPDGKYALSGGHDKVCRLWDLKTGQEARQLEGYTQVVRRAVFSRDGKYAATAGWDKVIKLWQVETGGELHTCEGHTEDIQGLCFTPEESVSCPMVLASGQSRSSSQPLTGLRTSGRITSSDGEPMTSPRAERSAFKFLHFCANALSFNMANHQNSG